MMSLIIKWLLTTWLTLGFFAVLNLFNTSPIHITYFEASFFAFVAMWCDVHGGVKQ